MARYRFYLFDEANRINRVIEFAAGSDAEACAEAARLHAETGHGVLELWRDDRKIYCASQAA